MSTTHLFFAVLATLAQEDGLPEAATLLDRREAALGPAEARAKVPGLVITGRVEIADMDLAATFEELHLSASQGSSPQGPSPQDPSPQDEKVRFTLRMGDWGDTTMGTDGRVSWTTDPGFGIAVMEGAEQAPVRRMWAIQRSAPWRTLYASARTLGVVERDGRTLYELEMQPPEGRPERWFLDRETNELVRVGVVYPGPTGGTLPLQFVLGDWKAVDGILYPHRRVQEMRAGASDAAPMMSLTYVCESIRHEALDPERLRPTAEVAAAIADPSKRAKKPSADASECKVEAFPGQHLASIRLEIDASAVSATLATTLPEVMGAILEQGVEMAGPPLSRYHSIDVARGRIDLEAGIPVKTPVRAAGRVQPSVLPDGRVATTWHLGSYHQLQQSYDRLRAWMDAETLVARGGFWEIYWTDPSLEPDPSTWRTQILWPVE